MKQRILNLLIDTVIIVISFAVADRVGEALHSDHWLLYMAVYMASYMLLQFLVKLIRALLPNQSEQKE